MYMDIVVMIVGFQKEKQFFPTPANPQWQYLNRHYFNQACSTWYNSITQSANAPRCGYCMYCISTWREPCWLELEAGTMILLSPLKLCLPCCCLILDCPVKCRDSCWIWLDRTRPWYPWQEMLLEGLLGGIAGSFKVWSCVIKLIVHTYPMFEPYCS